MKLELVLKVESRLGVPRLKVNINDYLTLHEGEAQTNLVFEFNCNPGEHELRITHTGKTVEEAANKKIDKHIEIVKIIMDEVELNRELWTGKFYPVYLHDAKYSPVFIQPNLYLGHNGTWVMPFEYPCIEWLIKTREQGPKLANTIFQSNNEKLESAKDFFSKVDDV